MDFKYIYAKLLKKARSSAVLNSELHPTAAIESGSSFINSKLGKHSFCGYDCEIVNTEIGNYVSIANNVIIGGAMHPMDWVSMSPVFYKGRDSVRKKFSEFERAADKKTVIGSDVWIGNYALIKQGITVGTGSVLGMGSVLTKDVGPYEIWAGSPAKFIRKRFDNETIEILLKSEWWLLPDDELQKLAHTFNDIEAFKKLVR
ncbi:MAG: CatB-related O-acetyltransferase [Bacteroidia bacterium]